MFRSELRCATALMMFGVFHFGFAQDLSYVGAAFEPPLYQDALHITAGRSDVPTCGTYRRCDFIPLGTDVHVAVLITNVSGHATTFRNLRWAPATEFEVRDADGNLTPETEELLQLKRDFYKEGQWVGPSFDDQQVLEPGKSVSFEAAPNRYYDMSRPGVYSIVAKRQNDEPPYEWVYSNEVKVTIVAKEEVPLGPGHY